MIGTTVYELTSFEIILGGIFMYVMGMITVAALVIYAMWKICNGSKTKKNSDDISKQNYQVN